MKLHRTEALSRERFGDHVRLRYRWDAPSIEPGRFIVARAGDLSAGLAPFLPRPFFVHDFADGVASLLFEVRGAGTAALADWGADVNVSEPLGRGFDLGGIGDGPVALIGGDVWVAPLKLLARRLALLGVSHDVYLELPATASETYVDLLHRAYPSATLAPTDGGPEAPRTVLERVGDLTRYRAVFASGPSEMLAVLSEACAGRIAAQLALRERMACADGSCFGCAVAMADGSYARACVEGPVFAAEELARPSGGVTIAGALP